MNLFYNNHYIRTDTSMNIIEGWSNGPYNNRQVIEDDILLTDKGSYQFRLFPNGEENPLLYTFDHIPMYKWDGSSVVKRTEEEIAEDRAAIEADRQKAEAERIANATETVLLEMVAEQEERICMLEMGVNDNDL